MAQNNYQLPPDQPEQDACNALQLCGGSFFTPYSYTGSGKKMDLNSTPCSQQPGGGETNSVWLQIHIASAGSVVFKIQPVNPTDDYNFAVLNITGKSCSSLTQDDVVRCNYTANISGSNTNGITGLSDTSRTPFIPPSFIGWPFAQSLFAKAGETYLIMINNDGNPAAGGSNKGFTIDFDGSAATFFNTASPQLNTVEESCNDTKSIIVKTNTPVLCSSISADGSDFISNAPASIVSAYGMNCTDRGGYTSSIVINFSSALPAGNYTISGKKGTDNNTLKDLCGNDLLPPDPISFIIKPGSKVVMDDEFICFQQLPYTWNGIVVNNAGDGVASYTSKAFAGCDSITILNLQASQPPQQKNVSANICDGDFYILPWDSTVYAAGMYSHHYISSKGCDSVIENISLTVFIPPSGSVQARDSTIETGFCQHGSLLLDGGKNFVSYLWNTGQTSQTIIVNIAGAYSVIAKDQYGCNTIDTFAVAAYPRPTADFRSIEHLCADSSIILNGGNGYLSYVWDNGSTQQTYITNTPGIYWVRLTDSHDCTGTDTVNVVTVQRPTNFLINSLTKCNYQDTILTPLNDFTAYTWSNGYNTKSIKILTGGLYWLKVTDDYGCTGKDSINVIDLLCPVYFFIPTAFTPNNDGLNDIFRPKFAGPLSGFHFSIYNRWGQLLFSSNDAFSGWDGTVSGYKQPSGVYIWICSYSLNGQSIHTEKGTVTLIR